MKKLKLAIIGQGKSGRNIHGAYYLSEANKYYDVRKRHGRLVENGVAYPRALDGLERLRRNCARQKSRFNHYG